MASTTDVANLALLKLGQPFIQSMDDGTPVADLAKLTYPLIVRRCLTEHVYDFAVRRKELSADGDAPLFGWTKAYTLPADCIRALHVNGEHPESGQWRVEGNKILCDMTAPLEITYISDALVESPGSWPHTFVEVVAATLASEWAESISKAGPIKEMALMERREAVRHARVANGQQGSVETAGVSSWIEARG